MLKTYTLLVAAICLSGCGPHSRTNHADSTTISPYAGEEHRQVKTLTNSEVDDLLAGRGMGFAKVAELNGYPGPRHVLDLADSLGLTTDQETMVRSVFDRMHAEAVKVGRALVTSEHSLDSLFSSDGARRHPDRAEELIRRAAELRGRLRFVHVSAHLQMMDVLTTDQIASYVRLRGYAEQAHAGHH